MRAQLLRGSKQQIAEKVAGLKGEVREAIVFIDERSENPGTVDDLFAEMAPYTVDVEDIDDSRESMYTRMEGE